MKNFLLTIYTPTYNREGLLGRLYASLCKQTRKDFLWLVIDDGSTDNTEKVIGQWKDEHILDIQYVHKNNGGVHTARDLAYEIVETELVWGVDSDDWLDCCAVENVLNFWQLKGSDKYCGIFAPNEYINGNYSAKMTYPPLDEVSFQDLYCKYHGQGDQTIILVSSEIKKVRKYPVFEDEKLVSEGFKWFLLPDKPFLIMRQFLVFVEYQNEGYTQNARRGYFKNLKGYFELHKVHVEFAKYFKSRVKYCIKYIITGLFLKKKHIIKFSPRPVLTLLLYPISWVAFLILLFKWKKYR